MRTVLFRALIAALCLAADAEASAEIREIGPGRYLCEAEAGRAERLDVGGFFGNGHAMAVRVKLLEARRDPESWSAAGLVFGLDSGRDARLLALASLDTDEYVWAVLDPPGDTPAYQMVSYRRDATVEISGTMTRGAIFARSRNARGQIHVGEARLARREIMCSSGRFEIELVRNPRPARRY